MKAYKQIRADIAKLEREAEAARKAESASIVAKIRKLAAEYDLTAADIGLDGARQPESASGLGRPSAKTAAKKAAGKAARKAAAKKASRSGAGVAKYRDPKSGKTWTGFGRVPQWLASAKKRDAFLIGPGDAGVQANAAAQGRSGAAPAESQSAPRAARKTRAEAPARKAVPAGKAARRPAAGKRAADAAGASEAPVSTP